MNEVYDILKSMVRNGVGWENVIIRLKEDYGYSNEEIDDAISDYENFFYVENDLIVDPEVDNIEL